MKELTLKEKTTRIEKIIGSELSLEYLNDCNKPSASLLHYHVYKIKFNFILSSTLKQLIKFVRTNNIELIVYKDYIKIFIRKND